MKKGILQVIGPGLLFAGAAIGVSHLVQATRAGALYGLGLVGVVLLANISKYPGLSFGSRYSNVLWLPGRLPQPALTVVLLCDWKRPHTAAESQRTDRRGPLSAPADLPGGCRSVRRGLQA